MFHAISLISSFIPVYVHIKQEMKETCNNTVKFTIRVLFLPLKRWSPKRIFMEQPVQTIPRICEFSFWKISYTSH